MQYTYFFILASSLLGPVIFSFLRPVRFYRKWARALIATLAVSLIFTPWDIWYTKIGVWGFTTKYTLSACLWGLPIEECLFFIVIPFACIFIYECISAFSFFSKRWYVYNVSSRVLRLLSLFFLLLFLLFYQKAYTASVFLGTSLVLILGSFNPIKGVLRWGQFLLAYVVVLVPFLIVNGMLTAFPVVWYDNNQNLELRIGSIPVEDFLYNFILVFFNVLIFNLLSQYKKKPKPV